MSARDECASDDRPGEREPVYEPPPVAQVLTAAELEQEIQYAGVPSFR